MYQNTKTYTEVLLVILVNLIFECVFR